MEAPNVLGFARGHEEWARQMTDSLL